MPRSGQQDGDGLQIVAVAFGRAFLGGGGNADGAAAQDHVQQALHQHLFPGCGYLALAVSRRHLGCGAAQNGGSELLLLSPNLLATVSGAANGRKAAPGVHHLSSCLAGAAILAGRPCSGMYSSGQQAWSDADAAARQCPATIFLCLPFKAPLAASNAAASSSTSGSSTSLSAALLLGTRPPQQPEQQPPEQQQPEHQHETEQQAQQQHSPLTAAPQVAGCFGQELLQSLLRLAAALVQHAQPELAAAGEALALLDRPPQVRWLHLEDESSEEEEEEEGAVAVDAEGAELAASAQSAVAEVPASRPLERSCDGVTPQPVGAVPSSSSLPTSPALGQDPQPPQGEGAKARGTEQQQPVPPLLEQEFRLYHSGLMADNVDAAGCLILLSILILLSKDPSAAVRVGHPLFVALAANLSLPLLVLAPGPLRNWYVQRREHVVQVFFMLALLVQQASTSFIDIHVSQAHFVNAGLAWITVDGLLLQMRFCRQLPTLLLCFLLNLGVIPEVCKRYHRHVPPLRCMAVATACSTLFLVVLLVILYLMELRMRLSWLCHRQQVARQAPAPLCAAPGDTTSSTAAAPSMAGPAAGRGCGAGPS